jgi:hypothetical protein
MVKEVLIAAKIVQRELARRVEPTWIVEPATSANGTQLPAFWWEDDLFGKPASTFPDHAQK